MGKKSKKSKGSAYTSTEKALLLLISGVVLVLTVLGVLGY